MPKRYFIAKQYLKIFQNKHVLAKFVQVSLNEYKGTRLKRKSNQNSFSEILPHKKKKNEILVAIVMSHGKLQLLVQ